MDYIQTVKMLLNIREDDENIVEIDALLGFFVDSVLQSILNYCNIRKLPKELDYVVVRMVADAYNEHGNIMRMVDNAATANVTSVSESGRTVSYGADTRVAGYFAGLAGEKLPKMRELDKFKHLYLV